MFVFGSVATRLTNTALINSLEGTINVGFFFPGLLGKLVHTHVSLQFRASEQTADASVNRGTPLHPPNGFLSKTKIFCLPFKPVYFLSSHGSSCLLFRDFLITSHESLWELMAARLPAEFYIRP